VTGHKSEKRCEDSHLVYVRNYVGGITVEVSHHSEKKEKMSVKRPEVGGRFIKTVRHRMMHDRRITPGRIKRKRNVFGVNGNEVDPMIFPTYTVRRLHRIIRGCPVKTFRMKERRICD
jgi:hypothetical protein